MYFSIALLLLTFATGIAGMVAVISVGAVLRRRSLLFALTLPDFAATRVTIVGGGGLAAVNSAYLVNLVSFSMLCAVK